MRDKARVEHIQAAISRIKAYTAALRLEIDLNDLFEEL
jgi:hypothetical protein